ncbi:Preprotein translocase secA family protein [Heracleum sosnowskyi]|uniref:Preprotein translocase secA family protein n=1 Tax=Heracleum sosnowskyi TaxID=360622 RepID=A0AAD8LX51_9APIA|nr:Preprotein translocase secA family protein [Heracleum sosnowskyi]
MWNFASNCVAGNNGLKNDSHKHRTDVLDSSDDELSSCTSREEGLECPICWESFNIVENVPYVLWCGHTLCKNCILGLQWAVVKFPTIPIQLPLFISCPWCNLLSVRLIYRGNLKFPRKNYFLLWMVESRNGDRGKSSSVYPGDNSHAGWPESTELESEESRRSESSRSNRNVDNYLNVRSLSSSLHKSLIFIINLTTKFPLVLMFLLIVLYVIPASAAIILLYLLITVLFAIPSFLILYFSYPSLDWLLKEIIT